MPAPIVQRQEVNAGDPRLRLASDQLFEERMHAQRGLGRDRAPTHHALLQLREVPASSGSVLSRLSDRLRLCSRASSQIARGSLVIPAREKTDSSVSWPAQAGHPRLCRARAGKTWMAATSAAMTHGSVSPMAGISRFWEKGRFSGCTGCPIASGSTARSLPGISSSCSCARLPIASGNAIRSRSLRSSSVEPDSATAATRRTASFSRLGMAARLFCRFTPPALRPRRAGRLMRHTA